MPMLVPMPGKPIAHAPTVCKGIEVGAALKAGAPPIPAWFDDDELLEYAGVLPLELF